MKRNMTKFHTNKGAGIFYDFIPPALFAVISPIFYIQATGTVHNQDLNELAKQKHSKTGVLEANRGTIMIKMVMY